MKSLSDEFRSAAKVLADIRQTSVREFLLQKALGITVAEATARAQELYGRATIEAETEYMIALRDLWSEDLYSTMGGNDADTDGGPGLHTAEGAILLPTYKADCE